MTERLHFHSSLGEGNGNPLQCSCLENLPPGTGEPDAPLSLGSHRVGHDWSDLAAAEPQAQAMRRNVWLPGGAGGSTLGHTGDTHTGLPSITDSGDGRGLTVLPCSLSCSHLSQMPQASHTSVKSSSFQSLLKLRHEALPDTPTPWRSWWILSCPAVAFFQLLIMWCHTVMSFLYLFGVRNNWKFTEYCKNKNSS